MGLLKDLRFRVSFGVSAEVAVCPQLPPPKSRVLQLFVGTRIHVNVPANDTALLTMLGGKDPETINKYVWPYILSLSLFGLTKVVSRR